MTEFDPYTYVSTTVHGGVREIVGEEAEKLRARLKGNVMSDRVSELAMEALDWSYKKYQTDTSGYDREYWYSRKLAQLVLEETIEVLGLSSTFSSGLRYHFELELDDV